MGVGRDEGGVAGDSGGVKRGIYALYSLQIKIGGWRL